VTFNAEDRRPPAASSRLGKSALEDAAPGAIQDWKVRQSDLAALRTVAPPASLADEEAGQRVWSAVNLLDLITPPVYIQYLNLPGQPGSRIPAHAAGDPSARAVARLSDLATCGKTGTKNDDLRRSLNDIARYNDVAGVTGGLWPIHADHAEAVRIWLEGKDTNLPPKVAEPTAAARLAGALAYARELGFPVSLIPAPMVGGTRVLQYMYICESEGSVS